MKKYLFILFLIASISNVFSQEDAEEIIYLAEENIFEENFENAIKLYKEILNENPDNAEINFKIGFCYLNIHNSRDKAIPYFETAIENYNKKKNKLITPVEMYYYLGKAHHINGDYVTAIEKLSKAKEYAIALKSTSAKDIVDIEIAMCNSAIDMVANPVSVVLEPLNSTINTTFDEIAPVISELENKIFFSSDYDSNTDDEEYVINNELYFSELKSNNWSAPVMQKNFEVYDADKIASALTNDGMFLILNLQNNLYVSNIDNNKVLTPSPISDELSTLSTEYFACYAYNNRAIIFSSDRRKGLGGKDLYIVFKDSEGFWSEPENMGPSVNSKYNEDCPFFYKDSVLFFSSDREISMGGYDIVYTVLNNDSTWSNVINIGYPVNSEADELSFSMLSSGNKGYFATNRTGTKGKSDIYSVQFDTKDVNYFTLSGRVSPQEVVGTVNIYDDNLNLLYDNVSIDSNGEFISSLAKNNPYFLSFSVEGFYPVVRTVQVENTQNETYDIKELMLQYVGINNLYSLTIINNDLDFKGQLIVENLKKISDKTLFYEINCCLNDILVAEKIKRQLMKSGLKESNININSYYETLEKEIIISISAGSEQTVTQVENQVANVSENSVKKNTANKTEILNPQTTDNNLNTTSNAAYTIQVGAFSSSVNEKKFNNLQNVKIFYGKDNFKRVTVGEFASEAAASTELIKIKALGYNEAFVRPISVYTNF